MLFVVLTDLVSILTEAVTNISIIFMNHSYTSANLLDFLVSSLQHQYPEL